MNEVGVSTGILGPPAGRLSGGRATIGIDLGNDDLGALLGKAFGGGAAYTAAAASDECNFTRKTRHEALRTMMILS